MLVALVGLAARVFTVFAAAGLGAPVGAQHFWPVKNGDVNRTGFSHNVAPSTLGAPSWQWVSDYPNDVVRATPLIDSAGAIYLTTVSSGRVIKFLPDGTELWRWSSVGTPYDNANTNTDQISEVPSIMDDSLYLTTTAGHVVSLALETGEERWRTNIHDAIPTDTYSMAAGFGYVIAVSIGPDRAFTDGTFEKRLTALDASGTKLWQFDIAAGQKVAPAYNVLVSMANCSSDGLVCHVAINSTPLPI